MTLTPSQAAALKWFASRYARPVGFIRRKRLNRYGDFTQLVRDDMVRVWQWMRWRMWYRITPLGLAALREWEGKQ